MVQLKPSGKALAVAQKILKQQGIKVPKRNAMEKTKIKTPYLQH